MGLTKFIETPRQNRSISYAALYEAGGSLEDLLGVARELDPRAELAEVPSLGVLVVRYLNHPDNHPSYTDYKVVPDGHYLAYSKSYDLLYESDAKTFLRGHSEMLKD